MIHEQLSSMVHVTSSRIPTIYIDTRILFEFVSVQIIHILEFVFTSFRSTNISMHQLRHFLEVGLTLNRVYDKVLRLHFANNPKRQCKHVDCHMRFAFFRSNFRLFLSFARMSIPRSNWSRLKKHSNNGSETSERN